MSPQQSLRIVTFEGNFTDDWLLSVIYADPIEAFDGQQTSEVSQVATADWCKYSTDILTEKKFLFKFKSADEMDTRAADSAVRDRSSTWLGNDTEVNKEPFKKSV